MRKPVSNQRRAASRAVLCTAGLFVVLLVALVSTAGAAAKSRIEVPQRAMGLLHDQCLSCHNEEKKKGGLSMHSRTALLRGGDSGKVISSGKPGASLLFKSIQPDADPHMPPKKQLSTNQIEIVRRWIAEGVKWDEAAMRGEKPVREVKLEPLPPGRAPVVALALAPDGRLLAIGRGQRILVHDTLATNFPVVADFEAHRDAVRALAWSPDGRTLASGAFRELTLWDTNGFKANWSVRTGWVGRVTALRFSSYGGALVAADSAIAESGWIRLFAAGSGKPTAAWLAHADSIYDLAVSPDGGMLATAGGDKVIKLWEVISQREIARLEGHAGAVTGLGFNTNGTELVSVSLDKQLKIWDVKTRESTLTIGGRKQGFNAAAWSANGGAVVAVDDGGQVDSFKNFKRHSGEQSSATADEKQLGRWPESLHAVAVSADGMRAFTGGQDGVVHAVSSEGKTLAKLRQPEGVADNSSSSSSRGHEAPIVGKKSKAKKDQSLLTSAATSDGARLEADGSSPSFVRDVMPLLARAGCAAGSCHAKADGQNGFKLSVFNYDLKSDFAEIVKEGRGRRVFPAAPDESLLLLKSTLAVEHGGGQRIEPGSPTHDTLLRWIRGGMIYQHTNEPALVRVDVEPREQRYKKGAKQPLRVTAHYTDDTTRDVTALADYSASDKEIAAVDETGIVRVGQLSGESAVVARYMGFVDASRITIPADRLLPEERYTALPRNTFIDDLAWAQFRKLGLFPSEPCTDAEFLRRSTLDTIGVLPSADEARAFLADQNPRKRELWIERLLAHPAYADFWANKWADLLRPNPDRVGVKSVFTLDQWLRESFRANKPYDQFAREILLAEGSNHRDGPAVIYRDRREPSDLTTMFSQLFLGVRMECAKCHHHPNEKWSQDDFYQFAAFFGTVTHKGAGLSPPISAGNETFYFAPGGTVKHPLTDEVMKPRPPEGSFADDPKADPRRALVEWLTAEKNPFFARAAVNRVWAGFFGRGFVDPVDDFRVSNPVVNEPLLNAVAADFSKHGYDLKHLVRRILQSRLYQLSSEPNEWNLTDTKNFSRSLRRRLPAEALLDAVVDVTGVPEEFNGVAPGARAMQTWSYKIGSHFLDAFGRPNSSSDCPCERDLRTSVVQSLHMMNSKALQTKLTQSTGRAAKLAASTRSPEDIVTELYFTLFNRPPTDADLKTATAAFAAKDATRQTATEDVFWALLNSAEFVFNH
jgi:WD40 repeat protein